MKKLFTLIVAFVLGFAVPSFAATYYGGAAAKNINADDLWFAAVTGSCAGTAGQGVAAATALQAGNTLIANGCTITIPNSASTTFTAGKLSIKKNGAANVVNGGTFNYATADNINVIIQADIEGIGTDMAGNTIGLSGAGSGSGGTVFQIGTLGSPVTITGGGVSSGSGVSATHTVGTFLIYGNAIGGSASTGYGVKINAASGSTILNGNATGGSAATSNGVNAQGAGVNLTVNGDCIGGSVGLPSVAYGCSVTSTSSLTVNGNCSASGTSPGCFSGAAGTFLTLNGSIIGTTTANGIIGNGTVKWNPGTLYTNFRYIKMFDGSGNPVYAVIAPNPSDVRYGVTYGWDGSTNLTGTARPLIGGALLLRGVGF